MKFANQSLLDGTLKFDHIKQLIKLTSDYSKQLSQYLLCFQIQLQIQRCLNFG